jgi:regulatory protein RepA
MTAKEWLQEIDERGGINKIFTDRNGIFIRINPMVDGGSSDDEVAAFRHVLVECDQGTKEEQLGAIRKLGLPVTAIIDSGKRSIHAWLRIDARSIEEYRERVAQIFAYCEQALGMKLDPKNRNPSRYSRMADVQRALEIKEDERGIPRVFKWGQQRLLEVNVPGKTWSEWVKDVDPTAPKPLSKFESWDDLEEAELPELKMSLDEILNQGAKMTIGGDSKAGKTWLLMHLAFSIATGRDWIGIRTHKGCVLYVNFEIQKQFFKKRGQSIKKAMGIPETSKVPNLMTWTLRGSFMTAEDFKEAILERIGDEQCDVIIIDPLYKLLNGADANAAGDMQKILAELEQIAERAGAALVYADHFSKGNQASKKAIDRISGSGATARDPDAIVTITELEDEGCYGMEFTLRNFKPVKPIAIHKQEGGFLFERRDDVTPATSRDPDREGSTPSNNCSTICLRPESALTQQIGERRSRRLPG